MLAEPGEVIVRTMSPSARIRFATRRERNLWLLSGVVVLAIYSTLGLATTLAEQLTDRNLLDNISALGFLILFGAVLLVGFRGRIPSAFTIAVALGMISVYALVFLRMASPIERSHLFEYSLLAILIHEALSERFGAGREVQRPGVIAVLLASAIGVVDELLQLAIPSRVFDPIDIGFNVFAAFMGVAVSGALAWAVRRRV